MAILSKMCVTATFRVGLPHQSFRFRNRATLRSQLRYCSSKLKTPTTTAEAAAATTTKKKKRAPADIAFDVIKAIWPGKGEWRLKAQIVTAVGCVFATKFFGIAVPYWFKGIIDSLSTDAVVAAAAFNPIGVSAIGLVCCYTLCKVLQAATQEARSALFATVVQDAIRRLSIQTATHLHQLTLNFHLNRQTGALAKSIDRGTKAVDRLLNFTLFHILPTALELILVSLVLYREAGLPFVVTACTAVGAYTVFTFVVSSWRIQVRKQMNKFDSDSSGLIIDGLLNYETVKYFQNEKYEVQKYDQVLREYSAMAAKTAQSLSFLNLGQQLIFTSALAAAMGMSVARVASGAMTLGDLILVNTLLMQLSMPLNFLGTVYRELQTAVTDMDNLFTLLTENQPPAEPDTQFVFKAGEIEFRNVFFNYRKDQPVLRGLSFKVPAGHSVGIVGPSGCGKSTIHRLLFKFHTPHAGSIFIDGQDITSVNSSSLRTHFGVIPQDCVLFNDTVLHNIKYGRIDATDEECIEASRKAGLHDTVLGFADGYNTKVGERGLKLSGGEKQRVSIARCLLRRAPILLADEATSALDTRTEALTMDSLRETRSGQPLTSIIIAHRLSTIRECDAVLVLKDGLQHEYGSHAELMERKGLYYDMWMRQQTDVTKA
eukprot:TRINITY_DN15580_c0_g1_i1.p1 TRINITY_DN15580_c0_g1~~TRINITY_DN15580_c0_g1_i1.p1  ORF type:complete len:676 (+),score=108.33 TRINITY_DN15580_c0_g1_i1:59-2029(+)